MELERRQGKLIDRSGAEWENKKGVKRGRREKAVEGDEIKETRMGK